MRDPITKPILLDVRGLSVAYLTRSGMIKALHDVDLQIRRREVVGLVGESGSGKTTLAWTILRYLGPAGRVLAGEILFDGDNLLEKAEAQMRRIRGKRISMVYQEPMSSLNPSLKVGEQIAEVLRYHEGLSRSHALRQAISLMERMNIPDPHRTARKYPHQLSGGMQQRVVIAIAIACNPDLLIMDEPTTALDVTTQAKILELVKELKAAWQWSILYITHDLAVVAQVADIVSVIYAGVIMETASVDQLFMAPMHPYTRGLLTCVPRMDMVGTQDSLPSIPGSLPDLRRLAYDSCVFSPRCAFANTRCQMREPPMMKVGPNHYVRCHNPHLGDHSRAIGPHHKRVKATSISEREIELQEPILSAENIAVYFTKRGYTRARLRRVPNRALKAVDGVDLIVRSGETLALVGETGCGKTTLARAVGQLIPPTFGNVLYHGRPLDRHRLIEFRRRVQFIFQNPDSALNPTKRIGAILRRAVWRASGMKGRACEERVIELLHMVDLPLEIATRYPHELSGGQKQRVCIARAFAYNPELVICDEPTAALDVSVQASILNLFIELQREFGTAYLFISHNLSIVRFLATYVVVMYLGKACEMGATEEVFSPPHHPYTEALLSAVPVPDPFASKERILLEGPVPSPVNPPGGCRFHTRCPKKIGNTCETEAPAACSLSKTHKIVCHLYDSVTVVPKD